MSRRRGGDGARLLQCVRTGGLLPLADAQGWDEARVEVFLERARFHRLDALVADLAQREEVPVPLAGPLRRLQTSQAVRRVALQEDARFVARVLQEEGSPWVALKGPVTAQRHHDRPEQRSYSDLDVLVRPGDFEAVISALVGAGAYLADRNWPLVQQLVCGELNLLLPLGTPLDLHWDLLAQAHDRAAFTLDSEGVVQRAVAMRTLGGLTIPAIERVDELLHLCLHAVVGGTNSLGRLRDIALVDLAVLDHDVVVQRAHAWGVGLVVAVALERAASVFERPTDAALVRRLAGGTSWRWVMRALGRWFPATQAPPATRRSSHLKLTRATAQRSCAYAVEELVGYALHFVRRRDLDAWDAGRLQVDVEDQQARRDYFSALSSPAR